MSEISEGQLKFGFFWTSYREQIKKIFILLLIVANVIMGIRIIYGLLTYFIGINPQKEMISQMAWQGVDYQSYQQASRPLDLVLVEEVVALDNGRDTFDILAKVKNPNSEWALESFTFNFTVDGTTTINQTSYIMPQQEAYLTHMSQNYSGGTRRLPQSPSINFSDWQWRRIKEKEIEKIPLAEFRTKSGGVSLGEDEEARPVTWVSAEVTNFSPYNFLEVDAILVVYMGDTPIGIAREVLREFEAGTTKTINPSWPNKRFSTSAEIVIEPRTNVLDSENVSTSQEGPGEEK